MSTWLNALEYLSLRVVQHNNCFHSATMSSFLLMHVPIAIGISTIQPSLEFSSPRHLSLVVCQLTIKTYRNHRSPKACGLKSIARGWEYFHSLSTRFMWTLLLLLRSMMSCVANLVVFRLLIMSMDSFLCAPQKVVGNSWGSVLLSSPVGQSIMKRITIWSVASGVC